MSDMDLETLAIDVPLAERAPDPFRPTPFADFLLNRMASAGGPSVLIAEVKSDGTVCGSVRRHWNTGMTEELREVTQLDGGEFRSVLARIGTQFVGGQIYGGAAERDLRFSGRRYAAAFYMANDAWRGYWLKIYIRPLDEAIPGGRDPG